MTADKKFNEITDRHRLGRRWSDAKDTDKPYFRSLADWTQWMGSRKSLPR